MTQRLIMFIFCACLAGCATTQATHFSYQGPIDEQGQKCVLACKQSRALCKTSCNPEAANCKKSAKAQYQRYVENREMMGLPLKKTLNDIYKAKSCAPAECGCDADFRSCYELCGGTVLPN